MTKYSYKSRYKKAKVPDHFHTLTMGLFYSIFVVIIFGFIYQSESKKAEQLKLPLWAVMERNSKIDKDGFRVWEEDIVFHGKTKKSGINERTARKDPKSRWPQGQIPYKIHPSYQTESLSAISAAMQLWMDNTCVEFTNSPDVHDQPHLVLKQTGTGCNSWIGIYTENTTEQIVSLDYPNCATSIRVVSHELGHAIGLWHEQDRLDRDDYLKIYTDNMGENKLRFESVKDIMTYDVPYEYKSIMQYAPDSFSSNGKLVLVPKDPMAYPLMGTADKMTFLDYKLVNRMYNCTDKCQHPPSCHNGGYATWNNKKDCRCECPPEFSGSNCETKVDVEPPCGGKIKTPTRFQTSNYPKNFPADLRCAWIIEAPPDKLPSLYFHDFNLMGRGGTENKCFWSSLRIKNGDAINDDPGNVHCANELHHNTVVGKTNQVLLVFTTMYNHSRGFDVSVTFV